MPEKGKQKITKPRHPPGPKDLVPGRMMLRFRRDPLGFLTRLAQDYGDVAYFRAVGLDFYLINNPEYIRNILVTRADKFQKGRALQRSKGLLGEGLLTSEGDFHRKQRRLVQPAFHPRRVDTYAQVMAECAATTAGKWRAGGVMDIHAEMMRLALNIAGRTLFGTFMEEQAEGIGNAMHVTLSMFNRAVLPWGKLLNRLPLESNRKLKAAHQYIMDTIRGIIAERRKSGVDRGDLLSILLAAQDTEGQKPGGPMSDAQLFSECYTLLTAGHETTANAMTFTFYLLAGHPEVQARLHAELDTVIGNRDVVPADAESLDFTRQVIGESLRLYPPAWTLGRLPLEAIDLGPFRLRAKSTVLISQWVTHRDPQFWPEPEKFLPDRWIDDSQRPRYAYFPFGGGVRQCIGESFAWMEAVLLTATLARQYRFELVDDEPVKLQPTITLRPRGGLRLRVMQRVR